METDQMYSNLIFWGVLVQERPHLQTGHVQSMFIEIEPIIKCCRPDGRKRYEALDPEHTTNCLYEWQAAWENGAGKKSAGDLRQHDGDWNASSIPFQEEMGSVQFRTPFEKGSDHVREQGRQVSLNAFC